jgi:hypothetical protein
MSKRHHSRYVVNPKQEQIMRADRGRPSFVDLWHDLRAASAEIRPDWDLSKPGLREAWDAGDYSPFHGWNKRSPKSVPTSYQS